MRMTSKDLLDRRLETNGLSSACTESEKIDFLWNKLTAAEESVDEMRRYVEMIQQLSDERESVGVEQEIEITELKNNIQELVQQLTCYHSVEVEDALVAQGLEHITHRSPGEQISYLLIERARLMDDIELEQARCYVDTPQGALSTQQLYSILINKGTLPGGGARENVGGGSDAGGGVRGKMSEGRGMTGGDLSRVPGGDLGWVNGEDFKSLGSDAVTSTPRKGRGQYIEQEGGRRGSVWGAASDNEAPPRSRLRDLVGKIDDLELMNELLLQKLKNAAPEEYEQVVEELKQKVSEGDEFFDGGSGGHSSGDTLGSPVKKFEFVRPADYDEAVQRLEQAERKVSENERLEDEMRVKDLEIKRLKRRVALNESVDGDSFEGSVHLGGGGVGGEAGRGLTATELRRTNEGLQRMLASIEEQLKLMKQQAAGGRTAGGSLTGGMSGDGGSGLAGLTGDPGALGSQLANVQEEFDKIRNELLSMMEKYNQMYRKYTDYKLASKNRMFKAKEKWKVERVKLIESCEKGENDLALVKVTLNKEQEYRENMEKSHHNLLTEQRDLLTRLSELEDEVGGRGREVSRLEVRCRYLEQEKRDLNERVELVTEQNHALEKFIKELQLDRDKVDLVRINTVSLERSTLRGGGGEGEEGSEGEDEPEIRVSAVNTTYQDSREFLQTLLSPRSQRKGPPGTALNLTDSEGEGSPRRAVPQNSDRT